MENPETHAILDTRYKTKKTHNTKKKDEQHWPPPKKLVVNLGSRKL